MPDTAIFIVGLFTFGLMFSGLMLSVFELKRLGREATSRTTERPEKTKQGRT